MGLVIVLVSIPVHGYDVLADPVGWALAVAGLLALRHRLPQGPALVVAATVAGVASLVVYSPVVRHALSASGAWALSLPQAVFLVLLTGSLAGLLRPHDVRLSRRLDVLRWAFVALLVAPALVYGGHVAGLLVPVALVATLADAYLVYLLFAQSRKPYSLP